MPREWIADDRALTVAVENALADELGLEPRRDLLLDYPEKTQMLGLDLLVQRRDGEVRRLTATGWEGAINLPKLSEEFYRSARWLRVYTSPRIALDPDSGATPGEQDGSRSARRGSRTGSRY